MEMPVIDFAQVNSTTTWSQPHDVELGQPDTEGLPIRITGNDPYFSASTVTFPVREPLWVNLRLRSEAGGNAQLFYFEKSPSEEHSIRFFVPPGRWVDVRVPLPALWAETHFRFDPPGTSGTCHLRRMAFELRPAIKAPDWPRPALPAISPKARRLRAGSLELAYEPSTWGSFSIQINGQPYASGHTRALLGYTVGEPRWLSLTNTVTLSTRASNLVARTSIKDPDGALWQLEQRFHRSTKSDAMDVQSIVTVDRERQVVYLPMWTHFSGMASVGTNKTQGLFAGLEYLENEPSSSKADLTVPASLRLVPHSYKITFPLMALAADGHYLGMTWEPSPQIAALHDSPDRLFHSGGHLMGLIFPGADPGQREDGEILPYGPVTLKANQPLETSLTLMAGTGDTVVPAIRQYVAQRGLPSLPTPGYTSNAFHRLEAHAWLDSKIRDGNRFRHAVGDNFPAGLPADASYYMDWLATALPGTDLERRLRETALAARAGIPVGQLNSSSIGHVRHPVAALVYGGVVENATVALTQGRQMAAGFPANGSILYTRPSGKTDLGATHSSREANGLAAGPVSGLLERALFTGDAELIHHALQAVETLEKFHHTVPRGAQTWEVPLHTPDILASAYLVRIYTQAYELTGQTKYLDDARYWAWTGVPFVYLSPPTSRPVGAYATIAVFGATEYVAPVWMGLPVQWCGLVYADALRRFARYDSTGPWSKLADGIAASGMQQVHPAAETDKQGLLPDSFDLINQVQNPVPINPATLMSQTIPAGGSEPLYDYQVFRVNGVTVHAPGPISDVRESRGEIHFAVSSWAHGSWYVLINGIKPTSSLRINGQSSAEGVEERIATQGWLVIKLSGPSVLDLQTLP
jgi:hypothetical protein